MKRTISAILILVNMLFFTVAGAEEKADEDVSLSQEDAQAESILAKGKQYVDSGSYDEAIRYFEDVSGRYSDIVGIDYYLGFVYYKKRDFLSAEKYFRKAVESDPYCAEAYYYLAVIENSKKNYEKVIEYLDMVTSIDKMFHSAYYNKGETYLALGRPEEAVKEFAYALYLSPKDAKALRGVVQAYNKMGLIEKDGTIIVSGVPLRKNLSPDETNMQIFTTTAGARKTVQKGEEFVIKSGAGTNDLIEIVFPKMADLESKILEMDIKGTEGDEVLKLSVKDKSTNRSPDFYIRLKENNWNKYEINLTEKVGQYIDIAGVESIRAELLTTDLEGAGKEKKIYVKNIRFL